MIEPANSPIVIEECKHPDTRVALLQLPDGRPVRIGWQDGKPPDGYMIRTLAELRDKPHLLPGHPWPIGVWITALGER